MLYLYPVEDTFIIFYDKTIIPEDFKNDIIEVESLPKGSGTLRRKETGEFYYEPLQPVTPVEPVQPEPIEDKIARLEQQMTFQNEQTLTIMDINLSLYEEIVNLRAELAKSNGTV